MNQIARLIMNLNSFQFVLRALQQQLRILDLATLDLYLD